MNRQMPRLQFAQNTMGFLSYRNDPFSRINENKNVTLKPVIPPRKPTPSYRRDYMTPQFSPKESFQPSKYPNLKKTKMYRKQVAYPPIVSSQKSSLFSQLRFRRVESQRQFHPSKQYRQVKRKRMNSDVSFGDSTTSWFVTES